MSAEWVTIGEFYDLNAAYLVRSRLEAGGIPVFLTNEQVVGLRDPQFLGGPGAQLQVPADEVEHAMKVLREAEPESESESESDEQEERPPAVPSTTGYRNGLRMLAFITLLGLLAFLLGNWLMD